MLKITTATTALGPFRVHVRDLVFHCDTAAEAAELAQELSRAGLGAQPMPTPGRPVDARGKISAKMVGNQNWRGADAPGRLTDEQIVAACLTSRSMRDLHVAFAALISFDQFQTRVGALVAARRLQKLGVRGAGVRYAPPHYRRATPAPPPAAPVVDGRRCCSGCGRALYAKHKGSSGKCRDCYLATVTTHEPAPPPTVAPPSAAPSPYLTLAADVLALLADGKVRTYTQIRQALRTGNSATLAVMQALQGTQQVVRVDMSSPARFRLGVPGERVGPVVRDIPVVAFDTSMLQRAVRRVLDSGASYDLREIVRTVARTIPQVEAGQVEAVLAPLVAARVVERVALGSLGRYRLRPVEKQTLADVEVADARRAGR